MKMESKIHLLHWLKRSYNVNVKGVKAKLKDKDFENLLTLLSKLKDLGNVYDPNDLISEYISDHRQDTILSQNPEDQKLDMELFWNTHAEVDGAYLVSLRHLLLGSWCRPTRDNVRALSKYLKEIGLNVTRSKVGYLPSKESAPFVFLEKGVKVAMPQTLLKYDKPSSWKEPISSWIYESAPTISLKGERYKLRKLPCRWEAYFNQRVGALFEMSELPYLYKHPKKVGVFEDTPPVLMLCELALRDIFKPASIKAWVNHALTHEDKEFGQVYSSLDNTSHKEIVLDTLVDSISGNLAKTSIAGVKIDLGGEISGWVCILLISYVKDALEHYEKELLV
jgi:hypothetical protein